ncbi:hypothetical protein SAMN05428954_1564 [Streptomyces sp. 2112.3]|nr:hypothetical protein BX261_5739 [Streptomyces sp. 2321.6]SDR07818.1 hypothetical protein SAMN05216511_1524 [Streptomyces sp. KS_16]SED76913.1 hypothetical protein SAMN05428940_5765 [Streptomyces sp. 2133.1]SEE00653.1 hypothetical protein SAMN05428954_1564 [Streptomyces sp. 2112.3]SNC72576.1 hypothetical protein SAMN06272741_5666 [Streptomyces sp. 2114.4]
MVRVHRTQPVMRGRAGRIRQRVVRERAVRALGALRLPRRYGEGPLHLLLMLASFALTGYAGVRLLAGGQWPLVLAWFAGAALLHDLVLLPLYALADRVVVRWTAGNGPHRARTAYVRVPAALSGLLLLVWFPLIAGSAGGGSAAHYEATTRLPGGVFLTRWLLVTAGLCALSALWLLVRTVQRRLRGAPRRRSETKQRAASGP